MAGSSIAEPSWASRGTAIAPRGVSMKFSLSFAPSTTTPPLLTGEKLQSVELPGIGAVAYRSNEHGGGRALVLVHGLELPSGPHEMRPLLATFPERPVYALAWPGFGGSQRCSQPVTSDLCARTL